jgi:hypothetical protein
MEAKLLTRLVEHVDRPGIGTRQLYRPADNGREDCFQLQRRIHRLADLAERLQFVDRLRQFAGACLHLLKQPHVLDGDDGLVSKRRGELNLLICERTDSGLHQHKHADWIALAQHGDAEHSAGAT